jgi:hypothetical protein
MNIEKIIDEGIICPDCGYKIEYALHYDSGRLYNDCAFLMNDIITIRDYFERYIDGLIETDFRKNIKSFLEYYEPVLIHESNKCSFCAPTNSKRIDEIINFNSTEIEYNDFRIISLDKIMSPEQAKEFKEKYIDYLINKL